MSSYLKRFFSTALKGVLVALVLLAGFSVSPARAGDQEGFRLWLDQLAPEMIQQGISPATIGRVWPTLSFDESVIELDQKQPEHKITFAQYLKNTLPETRVSRARELLDENRAILNDVAARYGVPAEAIVALWGIESSFGDNRGDDPVLNSLATLAYEGRRADFFKKELLEALRIIDEERRDPDFLQGSWAGAMGQCQFMPSTYRRFAVDYDGDGVRDIWENLGDVFASMARYLAAEGWQAGQGWGKEVMVIRPVPQQVLGRETPQKIETWRQFGVRELSGQPLTSPQPQAYLIQPDGVGGRSFLVYDNFLALMKWNRSTFFATSVGLFMDKLKAPLSNRQSP
ncbi:MAG TPA: lytic murein transglycosylase [Rhodospirillaceae bacterium]|nr:lytic murein transglycosylase [Rhodospirillaceae bacterium]